MKSVKTLGAALVMSALLLALSGCQKQEGPAEQAEKGCKTAHNGVADSTNGRSAMR